MDRMTIDDTILSFFACTTSIVEFRLIWNDTVMRDHNDNKLSSRNLVFPEWGMKLKEKKNT